MNYSEMLFNRDKRLLDKIKELEEENKRLSKNQRYYKNGVFSLEYDKETMSDMIDDYKSRIDKAIAYIEKSIDSEDIYEQFLSTGETKDLLKILKGEEKWKLN